MKNIFTLLVILITAFSSVAQVEKTVIAEHFTNTRCGTCASRNPGLYSLLEDYPQVLHIAYHPSSPYNTCLFSQHNPVENDARTNFYGIYGGTPRVVLSGEVVSVQNPLLTADQIDAELGQTSDFMVKVTQAKTDNDEVNIRLVVKKVNQTASQQILLFGMIAEKEVDYAAPNGENLHHDVFRKLLIDEDLNLSDVGDSIVYNETYTIHADWVADELFITALVQDENTGMILQAYASETLDAGVNFIHDNEILSVDGMLYPNPAQDVVYLSENERERFKRVDFYAMTGNLVKSFDRPASMNISELPEGIYMAVLTDMASRQYVGKIIKR